jgi:hypothetical protein
MSKLKLIPKNPVIKHFDDSGLFFNIRDFLNQQNLTINKPNKSIYLNCLIGGRGIGKSMSTLRYAIEEYISNKDQFVLIRRSNSQLDGITLFGAIVEYFPYDFYFEKGDTGQLSKIYIKFNDTDEPEIMCYLCAITTSHNLKGQNFPNVKTIIYDEFIPNESERTLNKEPQIFLEALESICRLRDDINVFCLSNATSLECQFFVYMQVPLIDLKPGNNILINPQFQICMLESNEEFINKKLNTRFGQLIKDTEYYNYCVGNEFIDCFFCTSIISIKPILDHLTHHPIESIYINGRTYAFCLFTFTQELKNNDKDNDYYACDIGKQYWYVFDNTDNKYEYKKKIYTNVLSWAKPEENIYFLDNNQFWNKYTNIIEAYNNNRIMFQSDRCYFNISRLFGVNTSSRLLFM